MTSIKEQAIKQVGERGRLIAEVAKDFGISNKQLYRWLREGDKPVELTPQQKEINQLRAEIYQISRQMEKLQQQVEQQDKAEQATIINFDSQRLSA